MAETTTPGISIDRSLYDTPQQDRSKYKATPGVSEDLVREISQQKNEPEWMLEKRLRALALYQETPLPQWGPDLSVLNLDEIVYYVRPDTQEATTWDEVPDDIKETFDKLGIPEAEKHALGGVGAQYDSDVVYHSLKKQWEDKGVIFENMDVAVQKYPELVKKYFMTQCVPINDHKFVMLHGAVWSGGTFIYVPKGVKVDLPLQAYFRMNAAGGGQFEHTLIIADEGSEIQYIEGCSAPLYSKNSLHAGCVELFVHKGARIRYSSIENWSKNTYNLNTKRALVDEDGVVEWINGNMGSGVTMLYPCSILRGRNARSDSLGIAFAGNGQNQDTGSKVIHVAPDTKSTITAKSISKDGGVTSYRGLVKVMPQAVNSMVSVECDALLLDEASISNTYPTMKIGTSEVDIAHEAKVGRIGDEEVFYLMSRGLSEEQAVQMVVAGFIEPIVKALPLEYALELNKLIELEMEGSVG
jgi:Fe-S cluster assembly protein SufB